MAAQSAGRATAPLTDELDRRPLTPVIVEVGDVEVVEEAARCRAGRGRPTCSAATGTPRRRTSASPARRSGGKAPPITRRLVPGPADRATASVTASGVRSPNGDRQAKLSRIRPGASGDVLGGRATGRPATLPVDTRPTPTLREANSSTIEAATATANSKSSRWSERTRRRVSSTTTTRGVAVGSKIRTIGVPRRAVPRQSTWRSGSPDWYVARAHDPARVGHDQRPGPGRAEGQAGDEAGGGHGEGLGQDQQLVGLGQPAHVLAVAEGIAGFEAGRPEGVSAPLVADHGHLALHPLVGHDGEEGHELGVPPGLSRGGDGAATDGQRARQAVLDAQPRERDGLVVLDGDEEGDLLAEESPVPPELAAVGHADQALALPHEHDSGPEHAGRAGAGQDVDARDEPDDGHRGGRRGGMEEVVGVKAPHRGRSASVGVVTSSTGTVAWARDRATTWSAVSPWSRLRAESTRRWARTGPASALMSSGTT